MRRTLPLIFCFLICSCGNPFGADSTAGKNFHPGIPNDPCAFAAQVVLGQPDFTSNLSVRNGLNFPVGGFSDGTRLFVGSGGRVAVWSSIPTTFPSAPDFAIGQIKPDLAAGNFEGVTARTIGGASSPFSDGIRLFVTDSSNNRILIWNTIPSRFGVPADFALGQPDLVSAAANNGGVSAAGLSNPTSVFSDGSHLAVSDTGNHRVLVWSSMPTQSGSPADLVLGQPDLTSSAINNGGLGAGSLNGPKQVYLTGGHLFVSDTGNNRILVWNSFPPVSSSAANIVLGQPNATSSTANNGGVTGKSLSAPVGLYSDGARFYAADFGNHRVLIWSTIPATNQAAANQVLGQPSVTSNDVNFAGVSSQSLWNPLGIWGDSGHFFVADSANQRVLIWNSHPITSRAPADVVLGQPHMAANARLNPGGISSRTTVLSRGIASDGTRLFDSQRVHRRVLVWRSLPATSFAPADFVLGQPDMASYGVNTGGVSAQSFGDTYDVSTDGARLFVAEGSRVLIWDTMPDSNFAPASVELGQPDFSTDNANFPSLSAKSLYTPHSAFSDGTRLFVSDLTNNRVLIWNQIPTSNQTPADVVLGQPDMFSGTANNGGLSAHSVFTPTSAISDGTRLLVADSGNHRVLIWNQIPTVNNAPADHVIGQPDLVSGDLNTGGISAKTVSPTHVYLHNGTLFVSDNLANRVLVWNQIPSSDFAPADAVIGQPDMSSTTLDLGRCNVNPSGMVSAGGFFWVADETNARVLAYRNSPELASPALAIWHWLPRFLFHRRE